MDPFTNPTSAHKTEVEPDIVSWGNTMVAVFQTGRFFDGGSSDTGWATSTNSGSTWAHGFLPGITKIEQPGSPYDRVSDPAVAYDAKHGLWLTVGLPLIDISSGAIGQMPVISSSSDGMNWNGPVAVAPNNGDFIDKEWITCDNTATSSFYGHCYVEFDDVYQGDLEMMTVSSNGGTTWAKPISIGVSGLGGQPLVLPNGTAVVPYLDESSYSISAFSSSNGGTSWSTPVIIATVNDHGVAGGNLRTSALPSAQIDGGGRVYVTWQDCSFRPGCSSNDIVMSTSTDGTHWTSEARIPIDPTNSTVDHFIPGIAADATTKGSTAHLGLTYYFLPQANCGVSSCQLEVGFIGSTDGGNTWGAPTTLTRAMNLNWLAPTDQGQMVGDYIATAFAGGKAHGIFAVAKPNNGTSLAEHMATNKVGLAPAEGFMRYSSFGERPLRGAHSDHERDRLPPIYVFSNE